MRRQRDPKPRPNGSCYLCGGERGQVALLNADPFCSTKCCQTYHAPLARRLKLFPEPGVLIVADEKKFLLTRAELLWVAEQALPQMRPARKPATRQEEVA